MSKVQVDTIVDKDDISAPTFSKGAIVTGVCTATTFVGALSGNATSATTATTASGNAGGLTGTPDITVGNVTSANVTNSKQTTSEHVNVTGVGTFGSDISVADNIVHTGNTNTAIKFSDNSITLDSAGSLALHIDGSAKIGFGTNDPQKPVDVYGESSGQLRVSNSSKSADLICDSTGGLLRTIGSYPLVFNTNQTDRLRVGTSGEIGLAVASGVSTDYGTSGQVLTSGGSGAAVSWADAGGGEWTLLGSSSGDISNGTNEIDITTSLITSTYYRYKVVFNINCDSDISSGKIGFRFRLNSSWENASYYRIAYRNASGTMTAAYMDRCCLIDDDVRTVTGEMIIWNPSTGSNRPHDVTMHGYTLNNRNLINSSGYWSGTSLVQIDQNDGTNYPITGIQISSQRTIVDYNTDSAQRTFWVLYGAKLS